MHPLRVIVDHHVILTSGLLATVSGDPADVQREHQG
jgi:hypothetical protein